MSFCQCRVYLQDQASRPNVPICSILRLSVACVCEALNGEHCDMNRRRSKGLHSLRLASQAFRGVGDTVTWPSSTRCQLRHSNGQRSVRVPGGSSTSFEESAFA